MRPKFSQRIALLLLCVFGAPALLGQGLHWVDHHDHGGCSGSVASASCCHHSSITAPQTSQGGSSESGYLTGECQICRFLATSQQPGQLVSRCTTSQRLRFAEPVADEPIVVALIDALFAPRGPPIPC